jgi:4-hydroxybenzoate polyprenyltransferase/phosphoserine phosphatase
VSRPATKTGDGGASVERPAVLAVDLDGTLLRSNMLHETLWSAFGTDWRTPLWAARELLSGRAGLKRKLADRSAVDVITLPYDDAVLAAIARWRDHGGKVVLVTATDQVLADAIALHLGCFDGAFGSDGVRNLKGEHKAAFLVDRYGKGKFAYVGDTTADLAVWREASHAIVKTNSASLLGKARSVCPSVELIPGPRGQGLALLRAIRPHQWLKNVLIFLAIIGAHQFDAQTLLRGVLAFISFSLVASSVYVVNDLLDLSPDRAHARKRRRPFAAGTARVEDGIPATMLLLLVGGCIGASLGLGFLLILFGYYVTTSAYSLSLKRSTMIDICTLAGLYTLRVLAGGVATGINLSMWLLLFSLFFFFSLAAVKRQAELVDAVQAGKLAIQGRGYHPDDLPIVAQMATAAGYVSVMVMALYVNSDAVTKLYHHPEALWGINLVLLFWISRMTFLAHRGQMHDDPVVFAARDRTSLACGILVLGFGLIGAV